MFSRVSGFERGSACSPHPAYLKRKFADMCKAAVFMLSIASPVNALMFGMCLTLSLIIVLVMSSLNVMHSSIKQFSCEEAFPALDALEGSAVGFLPWLLTPLASLFQTTLSGSEAGLWNALR